MEYLEVLLNTKRKRRVRHGLLQFFETVGLYLHAGYDLGYAWPESLEALKGAMPQGLREELSKKSGESMHETLVRLARGFNVREFRVWFSVIQELYESGAGLSACASSIAGTLRSDHLREWEEHLQKLPSKVNILVLLFFLPPTFLLLFYPLLLDILTSF